MSRIEEAAVAFHRLIWENTGDTDDWSIHLKIDESIHDEVIYALNELHDAIEESFPGSCKWPIKR